MSTLQSSIQLTDGVSKTLRSMNNAMNILIASFKNMQGASANCVDMKSLDAAQREIQNATAEYKNLENQIRNTQNAQNNFNQSLINAKPPMQSMNVGLQSMVGGYLGLMGAQKVMGFVKQSMDLSDVQRKSEIQLQTVLNNIGASQDAFEKLKTTAGNIQSKGIYGDESMIAGAAELATYIKDTAALEKMMGTLSNFAMGMTGGGSVDPKQMVQLATQLGKAANGTFDGLAKKGFKFTDAQEQILKNGSDMEKALLLDNVINESWKDLYQNMSNTPEGKIIQFNNAIGDMKELIGNKLYGASQTFVNSMLNSLPQIEKVMNGVGNVLGTLAKTFGWIANVAVNTATMIVNGWDVIAPILGTVTGAALAYKTALIGIAIAQTAVAIKQSLINGLTALFSAQSMIASGATLAQTAATWGWNAALMACPITWVVLGIMALIAALYVGVGAFNYFTDSSVSATGIIMGAFYTMGAFIHNVIAFCVNGFVAFCTFLNNVFVDPLTAIQNLFATIWNGIVGVVGQAVANICQLMSNIPFIGDKLKGVTVDNMKMNITPIAGGVNNSKWEMGYKNYSLAAREGYVKGANMSNFNIDPYKNPQLTAMNKIASNTDETAKNTGKMKDQMEMKDVEMKYLRDVAEREVMNRFTTAEIKVDMTNNNTVSSDVDINAMIGHLNDAIMESMQTAAEGVHA